MMFNFNLLFCDGVQSRSLSNLTDSPLGSGANQFNELEQMNAAGDPHSLQLNDRYAIVFSCPLTCAVLASYFKFSQSPSQPFATLQCSVSL